MADQSLNRIAADTVLALPNSLELPQLRAEVSRAKTPNLPAGACWDNAIAGSFSTTSGPDDVMVEWQMAGCPKHSALFAALGDDPKLEAQRLELGRMIANMARLEAFRMLEIIPGPNEAMAEANHFYREEDRWRCWAEIRHISQREQTNKISKIQTSIL